MRVWPLTRETGFIEGRQDGSPRQRPPDISGAGKMPVPPDPARCRSFGPPSNSVGGVVFPSRDRLGYHFAALRAWGSETLLGEPAVARGES
jgi:hypothetical protein